MISINTNKPIAIVLGGTYPHITLLNKLKGKGYYTILVDYYKQPIAKEFADVHLQESTLDNEKVLVIAKELDAKLVISSCIDHANATACYVADKLGLPSPYSYEVATTVTEKNIMKKMMLEHGIPTSKYISLNTFDDYKEGSLTYPLIVKPSDSNSSKGVRRANNFKELVENFKYAKEISRNGEVIIEEFKIGKEIGVDCYIQNNESTVIMTRERKKIDNSGESIQQIYGSYWPADISSKNLDALNTIATNIAKAFNFNNTPLLLQAIVSDDEINVIEFAPRIGGGENYNIISLHTNFDIIEASINSFLGNTVDVNFNKPRDIIVDNYIYAKPAKIGEITGYKELIEEGIIEYFHVFKKPGMEIGADIASTNRVGAFIVKSADEETIRKKMKIAIKRLEVFDFDGNPIMRKDLYQTI